MNAPDLKNTSPSSITRFVNLAISILPLLLIFRIIQYILLWSRHAVPPGLWKFELAGLLLDVLVWMTLAGIILGPYLILSKLHRRVGLVFFWIITCLFFLIEWGLFSYFIETVSLLDQVVYSYSIHEMYVITLSSVRFGWITFLPVLLVVVAVTGMTRQVSRKAKPLLHPALFLTLMVLSATLVYPLSAEIRKYDNTFNQFAAQNKTNYFLFTTARYLINRDHSPADGELKQVIARYQANNPRFSYTGPHFPLLHDDKTPDLLGPYFNLKAEKPNIVILIMESLSGCFIGDNPIFGSYTPFIDSLAFQSLFWNNMLSTADRTFNVLPALLASLPPGDPTIMTEVASIPFHTSLIRTLRQAGYYSSFYYGGDPAFNHMKDFLLKQENDFILSSFGPKYQRFTLPDAGYLWGYPDDALYARSFEVIDSLAKNPRLDIYLTISLHSPFTPPDQEKYLGQVEQRLAGLSPDHPNRRDIETYKNIFATILYTDAALKQFFNNYRQRPDFENTIFIITGDHGLPELNLHRFSGLTHYNVPLLIYSPMLKAPRFMRSYSSHLDVAPSIQAMLREKYHIETLPATHWLGEGLDTAVEPRNIHRQAFILNNKEINEYLDHDLFLCQDRLYTLLPECWLKDTVNPSLLKRMQNDLDDFKRVNTYVSRNNRIIPPQMLFGKAIDTMVILQHDTVRYNASDSAAEYRSLYDQLPIDARIRYLRISLTAGYYSASHDPGDMPEMVFDLYSPGGKQLLWQAYDLPFQPGNKGTTHARRTMEFTTFADISYFKRDDQMKLVLYFWNRKQIPVRFTEAVMTITGYY